MSGIGGLVSVSVGSLLEERAEVERLRAENAALREQLAARETVPALTREAAYQLVEDDIREARLNSDWPSFEFLTSSVRLSSFYAGVIRRSSLLEAVDALRKEDGHG